jgi:hypothetical protein
MAFEKRTIHGTYRTQEFPSETSEDLIKCTKHGTFRTQITQVKCINYETSRKS